MNVRGKANELEVTKYTQIANACRYGMLDRWAPLPELRVYIRNIGRLVWVRNGAVSEYLWKSE